MRCSYEVDVAERVERVWDSVADVDRVLAALPGATLSRDGDTVSGSLKCKLGANQITYRLSVRAEVGEAKFHTAVIAVTGKEARGGGTIAATLTFALRDEGAVTRVDVNGEIEVTGRAEAADDAAWARFLGGLVTAALPSPHAEPVPPPRPALSVAEPPADAGRDNPAVWARRGRIIIGAIGLVGIMFARRAFRRKGGRNAGE
jgi:uncharacterized protein